MGDFEPGRLHVLAGRAPSAAPLAQNTDQPMLGPEHPSVLVVRLLPCCSERPAREHNHFCAGAAGCLLQV